MNPASLAPLVLLLLGAVLVLVSCFALLRGRARPEDGKVTVDLPLGIKVEGASGAIVFLLAGVVLLLAGAGWHSDQVGKESALSQLADTKIQASVADWRADELVRALPPEKFAELEQREPKVLRRFGVPEAKALVHDHPEIRQPTLTKPITLNPAGTALGGSAPDSRSRPHP